MTLAWIAFGILAVFSLVVIFVALAEECPVRTLLGQTEDCTTVTFISRAMCQ